MQTQLGGEGRLVSGGEGQRVRFGRAMQRQDARLVILDEPFRGLDHEKRQHLLAEARSFWSEATLLCVTHDVAQTQNFERVLVIEEGQIVEDGSPSVLKARPSSRYKALLDAEENVRHKLWASPVWRRLWLDNGKLQETIAPVADNLKQIRGIGQAFANRLDQAGIRTFAELAQQPPERLLEIVASGRNKHLVNPEDWIKQARKLADSGR